MAKSDSSVGDVFDVRKVRRLVELMNDYDLAEIDLRQGDQRIQLRKLLPQAPPQLASPPPAAAAPSPPAAVAAPSPAAAATDPAPDDTDKQYVTSPTVGTFYTAANPDAAPFVQVGDHVGPESVVCIIEAMKVFNEIQAECSGRIVAMLVENGEPVEYGQPLFEVEPQS